MLVPVLQTKGLAVHSVLAPRFEQPSAVVRVEGPGPPVPHRLLAGQTGHLAPAPIHEQAGAGVVGLKDADRHLTCEGGEPLLALEKRPLNSPGCGDVLMEDEDALDDLPDYERSYR